MSATQLPAGWVPASLRELCLPIETVRPELEPEKEFTYVDISSIDRERRAIVSPQKLTGREAPQRARQLIRADDIVFSTVRPNLRTIAVVPDELDGEVASTGFCILRPSPALAPRFMYYAILSEAYQRRVIAKARGINYPAVREDDVLDEEIGLPPRAEQERIVETVERLLPAVRQGAGLLDTAEAQLRSYRSAVLAATVAGRGISAADTNDAHELLEQILEERRAHWNGRGRYRQPVSPDPAAHAIELPEQWTWATVDQLALAVEYGTSAKTSLEVDGDAVPVLRMGNIRDGEIDLTELKYLPADHADFPAALLKTGDVLFNRTNSAELVGKAAVYQGTPDPCGFASYLIRLKLTDKYRPDMLVYFLSSWLGRRWIRTVVSQQVGQANVNGTKLKSLTVPLPPLAVQDTICAGAVRQFRVDQALRKGLQAGRARAAELERAILDRAQEGSLVAQYATDEPAQVLLDRIRAERPDEPRKRRGRRRAVVLNGG